MCDCGRERKRKRERQSDYLAGIEVFYPRAPLHIGITSELCHRLLYYEVDVKKNFFSFNSSFVFFFLSSLSFFFLSSLTTLIHPFHTHALPSARKSASSVCVSVCECGV